MRLIRRLDGSASGFEAAFAGLVADRSGPALDVADRVASIIAEVRRRGDEALVEFTRRFDRLELEPAGLRVAAAEIDAAVAACAPEQRAALALAAERIRAFHERLMPQDLAFTDGLGVVMGLRWTAIDAVGLYVPGGTAAYPSSVLMNAIPAKVAGCRRLVMVAPTPDGRGNPLVLAAARLAGVDEVYRIGGAQAVAALAHGTATLAAVDLVVGPGNAYVAEAKRQLFGTVGIDMIAGPSEVVIVADAAADPDWIAADLLAQAEHDEAAQAILITDHAPLGDAVEAALQRQLPALSRQRIAGASIGRHGCIILVPSLDRVPALVDRLAPEHLQLVVADPGALAGRIRHAGSIFLGGHTPEVIGDYVGGPNHVLPTSRSARFASGLSVQTFLKRTTHLACDGASLRALGPAAATLARSEGLDGHARAIELRLGAAGRPA